MSRMEEDNDQAETNIPRKRKAQVQEIEIDVSAAEPPSKRALRKQKKIKTRQANSVSQPFSPKASAEAVEDRGNEISPYGVWMGNLPFTASKDDIRRFLVQNTDMTPDDITRVNVPSSKDRPTSTKQSGKTLNRGFAYVDFDAPEAQNAALSLSERLISGRRILIKDSKDFNGRPEKPENVGMASSSMHAPTNRIFVGNLGFELTKEDIFQHFSRCGEVINVHMATFEDSGKCKGFAWVTFGEEGSAAVAMRGWTKVPISDGMDSSMDTDSKAEEGISSTRVQKPKMKKIWLNRINGRILRIEFAEDKALRYKKRFDKDGTGRRPVQAETGNQTTRQEEGDRDLSPPLASQGEYSLQRDDRAPQMKINSRTPNIKLSSIGVSRLTGGLVEAEGSRIVF